MTESRRVPDILVEKLALAELDSAHAQAVRAELEAAPAQQGRLVELEQSNEEILRRYEPEVMVRRIAQRAARQTPAPSRGGMWRWPALAAVPLAAAAVLFLALFPLASPPREELGPELTRSKGDAAPSLYVYRQRGTAEELLVDGQGVAQGDVLQLRYAGRGKRYGLIFSLDGRGEVTRHLPARGAYAEALPGSGVGTVPTAYALDDAPRFERFYFVVSDTRFAVAPVLSSAEDLAAGQRVALDLPPDAVALTFTVVKR